MWCNTHAHNTACVYVTGPVAGALCTKFGSRGVSFVGSAICSVGALLATFSQTVTHLYITIGVMVGKLLHQCLNKVRFCVRDLVISKWSSRHSSWNGLCKEIEGFYFFIFQSFNPRIQVVSKWAWFSISTRNLIGSGQKFLPIDY